MEVCDQSHALAIVPPGKGSRYPLNGRLGGPRSRDMKVHKHNAVMIVYILALKKNVNLPLHMPWRHTDETELILNLGTTWRWVLNFTHRYPVIRRRRAVEMFEERKITCLCKDLNLDPPPPILVTILTTLSWLLCLLYIRFGLFFSTCPTCQYQKFHNKFFTFALFVYSMAMIKSRLLNQRSLASTIIGVIPKEPEQHLDISVSNK